ncbi:MAG TPA: crosslink repair DNA glycosylase YcaQ family protein [Asanoa sp.]|nr:crosslink repair DNA glycosylase YcaQ family protein [Asanoa sp.]
MSLTWSEALSWRLRRQFLDPVGSGSVADVVRRLGAIPAYPDHTAELAIRLRRADAQPGDVAAALADGEIIKTYAFRGATHLLTPEDGGAYLALRAAGRMWELPSWQSFYRLPAGEWPDFRKLIRELLTDGPMSRDELAAAISDNRRFGHLTSAFDGNDTLIKPLTWQGDISFGPARDGRATFQRLDTNPRWAGLPDLDQAGRRAIETYFRAYGPATPRHVQYWLGEGLGGGRKRIRDWITDLGDRLAAVRIDGEPAYLLREDLDELTATPATRAVRFLPGYDQWVLGPGTADPHVVPPARRKLVSRKANLVIARGAVSGTWTLAGDEVVVAWFAEAGRVPKAALADETQRLAEILDKPLRSTVETG